MQQEAQYVTKTVNILSHNTIKNLKKTNIIKYTSKRWTISSYHSIIIN